MKISKKPLLIVAASLTLVAGCAGNGGPNDFERTRQGAAIGAAGGAALGALINRNESVRERNQGALIGAALGAGLGGAIGNNLDRQAEELRQSLGNGVGVTRQGDQLIVTLSQDILFATNSTAVSGASQSDLATVAGSLNRFPNTTVNVIGHTDNVGSAEFNQGLSQRRAQAVASLLVSNGVSSSRVRSIGAGENQPIASNQTDAGRQQNRRVEIIITEG